MILRRLYLLLPGFKFAQQAVDDLLALGVDRQHIHTVARPGVDTTGLPEATVRQRSDLLSRLDRWIWDINLLLFFFALGLFAVSIWSASWAWAIAWLLVMGVTVLFGNHYAQHVPHAQMNECRTALRHGEILLMVDVPRWQMATVEKAIRKKHPELEVGGVSWSLDALGI
ncbi:MAG: hypothetical protein QNJ78_02990 [Gammaproteobacteria bacterium]|nr:hypothetical protein [Gammaproteobacteria bacterium]